MCLILSYGFFLWILYDKKCHYVQYCEFVFTSEYMTYAAMDKFPFLYVQCNKR